MSHASRRGEVPPGGVQTPQGAPVLGSPRCEICGKALDQPVRAQDRHQATCSSRCRGIRWRQRRHAGLDAAVGRIRDGCWSCALKSTTVSTSSTPCRRSSKPQARRRPVVEAWREMTAHLGQPHLELEHEDVQRWRGSIVYVWTRGGEVLYVGLSARGLERPLSVGHAHLKHFAPGDRLIVWRCAAPGPVEAELIAALRPRYNIITRTCPQCGAKIRWNAASCDRHRRPRRRWQGAQRVLSEDSRIHLDRVRKKLDEWAL